MAERTLPAKQGLIFYGGGKTLGCIASIDFIMKNG
jgi:hypothetical protein